MAKDGKKPVIDPTMCTGCGLCVDECESKVLEIGNDTAVLARPDDCTSCGHC